MLTVNVHEAKTNLSSLLAKIESKNESVMICRNGKPVAELRKAYASPRKNALPPPNLAMAIKVHGDPTTPLEIDELPEDFK